MSATIAEPPTQHAKFGALVFDQRYKVVTGIAGLVFGIVMLLAGAACFTLASGNPKFYIGGVCGLGVGIFGVAFGIHFLVVKTGQVYEFFERGLVYRNRAQVTEAAYKELAGFSVKKTQSGGKMPGTFFNMQFVLRDGKMLKYQLGVDQGDDERMTRAQKLIELIQGSVSKRAAK